MTRSQNVISKLKQAEAGPSESATSRGRSLKPKIPWRRRLQTRTALATLLLFYGFSMPVEAQRTDAATDAQVERAAELAAKTIDSGKEALNIDRRRDLEALLSSNEKKPAKNVYFYEMQRPAQTVLDAPNARVIAVAPVTREIYELYDFQKSKIPSDSSQEFNRLMSNLEISISEPSVASFARLYLGSCDAGGVGQIIFDEDGLRSAVENYYFESLGDDVWRTLKAYAWWWPGFQKTSSSLQPTVKLNANGFYDISLKELVTREGKHPELHQWDLEISREGKVRALATQLIFPPEPRWLFFDSF